MRFKLKIFKLYVPNGNTADRDAFLFSLFSLLIFPHKMKSCLGVFKSSLQLLQFRDSQSCISVITNLFTAFRTYLKSNLNGLEMLFLNFFYKHAWFW